MVVLLLKLPAPLLSQKQQTRHDISPLHLTL
jgi:chaperonin GroEL (HSP60 family)